MDRHREKICCNELQVCLDKCKEAEWHYPDDPKPTCITQHPAFKLNCLAWEVIDVAWLGYKQQYGKAAYENYNVHKRRRHVAYRQLARLLHKILGRENRYILPSCAVKAIRDKFPAAEIGEHYKGFMYADEG